MQALGNGFEVNRGLSDRYPRLQAGNDVNELNSERPGGRRGRVDHEWGNEFGFRISREAKAFGHHSNDGVNVVVERECLPEDVPVTIEMTAPE
jgi:hypothetical protein